ncbi:MAG: primosomal protein N' [Bacteroidetes bacterium]|nr:primosomal protein N' [Bacteroidota bacterium]
MTGLKLVVVNQNVDAESRGRKISYVKLGSACFDEVAINDIFQKLEIKSPKQFELLLHFYNQTLDEKETKYVAKTKLLKASKSSSAILAQLCKKNILETFEKPDFEIPLLNTSAIPPKPLSQAQQVAYENINREFLTHEIVLLHGVTGSGKTEIYIHLIEQQIKQCKQVLYLLPEIALTTQIIQRLQLHFGEQLLVYHSKLNEHERLETYNRILKYEREKLESRFDYQIVIGARSATFLPFSNLGLVIIDEEHEPTYKQQDPAPRYHARDSAIVLAHAHNAKVLLGSATPAVETYYNCLENKYGLVKLNTRYNDILLPSIELIDLKEAYKRKRMKSIFEEKFLAGINNALQKGEQVILFQNRRGYARMLECSQCAYVPQCINCDVSLTYHKYSAKIICHYCGYKTDIPKNCKACGNPLLKMKGTGTEKVEDELSVFFNNSNIARLDLDAARTRNAYQSILNNFADGSTDILVGTQMISKGLDFENVTTVGIVNADSLLNFPDFRSVERSFQLMVQVAGRAGRKHKQGHVMIQTYNPQHKVFEWVVNNDYASFIKHELAERKMFHYPPFYRLLYLTLKHKDFSSVDAGALKFVALLREQFGGRILGPVTPDVSRINNMYIQQIVMKIERDASMKKVKQMLHAIQSLFFADERFHQMIIIANVDPL